MRGALVVLLFLTIVVEARADAWVPAGPTEFLAPDIVQATDGTVAYAEGSQNYPLSLVVRPLGGEAIVTKLGGLPMETDVAVAPGGWVALAWTDLENRMQLAVRRPDGTITRSVLDKDSVSKPVVGIDGAGNVLVAWRVRIYDNDVNASGWLVRSAAGPGLVRGPKRADAFAVDVAVTASGHRLLTWASETGTFAQFDDEPAARVGGGSWDVTAAVNETGAALVAADARDSGPAVAQHPAGGGWAALRDVAGSHVVDAYLLDDSKQLFTVLAADGRAAVAWLSRNYPGPFRVYGTAGTVGGGWGPPTRLSSVFREANVPAAVLDPAGNPWVTWEEADTRAGYPYQRGAKAIAGAQPDTTPLQATMAISSRRGRVRARVRCAKACDAQLRVGDAVTSRELRANRSTTVWLPVKRGRRVRVQVAVADRAGHVRRSSRTLRVR